MSNHAARRPSVTRLPTRSEAPPAPPPHGAAQSPYPLPPGGRELSLEDEAALAAAMEAAPGRMAAAAEAQRERDAHDRLAGMLEASDLATVMQKLPELYGQAIAGMVAQGVMQAVQALQAVPVKVAARLCSTCLELRIGWNSRHHGELMAAQEQAMALVGTADPADPRIAQMDLGPLLPEHLRPGAEPDGLPVMFDAVTTVNGTDVCHLHHPAAVSQRAGGRLILMPGLNAHAAAHLAMNGTLPGVPAGA